MSLRTSLGVDLVMTIGEMSTFKVARPPKGGESRESTLDPDRGVSRQPVVATSLDVPDTSSLEPVGRYRTVPGHQVVAHRVLAHRLVEEKEVCEVGRGP